MTDVALGHPRTLADVGALMRVEFRSQLPSSVVSNVMDQARRDLHGQTSREALPELLFRLARARLSELLYAISY